MGVDWQVVMYSAYCCYVSSQDMRVEQSITLEYKGANEPTPNGENLGTKELGGATGNGDHGDFEQLREAINLLKTWYPRPPEGRSM